MSQQIIYDDGVFALGLVRSPHVDDPPLRLALRWLEPQPYIGRHGALIETTNLMGGATDWFILPVSFAYPIGRELIQMHAVSNAYFDPEGLSALVDWLVHDGELSGGVGY